MTNILLNKQKIINDPVYGFITIPFDIIFDLIEHPFFQRLRRIRQLGLTCLVYPGANHTRFQHALGAMHLIGMAIEIIRSKGHEISDEEAEAVTIAILLHDIGHGPFSHSLENSIIEGINHEEISLLFMKKLNDIFEAKLELAIKIYTDNYYKKFLHQLVNSQLDVDRLDYLRRDSFFTGVIEGAIGSDRIIKMLNVKDDNLVLDLKGIYSYEKFLIARRLMYWQVYYHKTVIASEYLLINILQRAKYLTLNGFKLFAPPALQFFLSQKISAGEFNDSSTPNVLEMFSELDDNDIFTAAKVWKYHPDKTLSILSTALLDRKLFRLKIRNNKFKESEIDLIRGKVVSYYGLSLKDAEYLVVTGEISNFAYNAHEANIKILIKNENIADITEVSELLNSSVLSKNVVKHFLCYPKVLELT